MSAADQPGPTPAESAPEPHRQVAESFGVDAERYDRTRPRYPDTLVDRIAARPGLRVLDVGCGTGIAARQLQAAKATVLGVEPDARMADFARRSGVEVDVATFEAWEPGERTFDAVVAGQAWHWVDPVKGPVKAARVLRAGGRLAAFWYVSEPPAEVSEALALALERVLPESPIDLRAMTRHPVDVYQVMVSKAADGIRAAGRFGEPEHWRFDEQRSYGREEWLDQLPTSGALTRLPPSSLAAVLRKVGTKIDATGSPFPVQQTTLAVTALLEPA